MTTTQQERRRSYGRQRYICQDRAEIPADGSPGPFPAGRAGAHVRPDKVLRITVPEDLEYGAAFDDIFETFTTESRLTGVKTTNLGSLNRLTYAIHMKEAGHEKELIDALRVRNGNLEINMMLRSATEGETL